MSGTACLSKPTTSTISDRTANGSVTPSPAQPNSCLPVCLSSLFGPSSFPSSNLKQSLSLSLSFSLSLSLFLSLSLSLSLSISLSLSLSLSLSRPLSLSLSISLPLSLPLSLSLSFSLSLSSLRTPFFPRLFICLVSAPLMSCTQSPEGLIVVCVWYPCSACGWVGERVCVCVECVRERENTILC